MQAAVIEGGACEVFGDEGDAQALDGGIDHQLAVVQQQRAGGIEGLLEAVAQFGIEVLIAEPGPIETGFGMGLDRAPPLAVYDATPAGDVRRGIADGSFAIKGDAVRTVAAMIAAADAAQMPRRLALGSTAFDNIQRALRGRLDELLPQRQVAYAADKV